MLCYQLDQIVFMVQFVFGDPHSDFFFGEREAVVGDSSHLLWAEDFIINRFRIESVVMVQVEFHLKLPDLPYNWIIVFQIQFQIQIQIKIKIKIKIPV